MAGLRDQTKDEDEINFSAVTKTFSLLVRITKHELVEG